MPPVVQLPKKGSHVSANFFVATGTHSKPKNIVGELRDGDNKNVLAKGKLHAHKKCWVLFFNDLAGPATPFERFVLRVYDSTAAGDYVEHHICVDHKTHGLSIGTPATGDVLAGRDFSAAGQSDSAIASATLVDDSGNNNPTLLGDVIGPDEKRNWSAAFSIPKNYPNPGDYTLTVVNTDNPPTVQTAFELTLPKGA